MQHPLAPPDWWILATDEERQALNPRREFDEWDWDDLAGKDET